MGLADLHIHSIYSYDGTSTIPAILKYTTDYTDLDVIAITDHDSMRGCQEALELAPNYGIEVIPGCEVNTAEGHLLTLFIDRPVKAGRSLIDTLQAVGKLGGVCIAAHPMARGTNSLSFAAIWHALKQPGLFRVLIGVEAFNGGLVYTRRNPAIAEMASMLPISQVGNSDAHILSLIGQGSTQFEGKTSGDLRAALLRADTQVRAGNGLNGFGVIRSYLPKFLLRKLGWAIWNAYPQAPMQYVRFARMVYKQQPYDYPGESSLLSQN